MKNRSLLRYILFPFLALFFFIACGEESGNTPQEKQIDNPASSFKLNDLSGKPVSLADHKGKVVLLRFWSTACKSCKEEMPKLETVYQELNPSGLVLLAINIKDSPEKIIEFIDGMGLTFPILIDENKSTAKNFKAYGVPTSFLIDKEGIIKKRFFGDLSEAETIELIKPLL